MTRRAPARRRTLATSLALCVSLALGACSSDSEDGKDGKDGKDTAAGSGPRLRVTGAYMPQPTMADMAAGFMVVRNDGGEKDKLTSVTSELSDTVEIHETVDQQMQQVKSLAVPANGELQLSRGGNHLMFHDLIRKPEKGDKITLTLHFAKSDPVKLSVPVKAANHQPAR
ncbi:copper chaperone PCu(A)C [Streptomyces oceani]|uniref:Copper resistance protein CopZ n=1 Tax=Streptomyces oceani TaxID=1075402 RepID=A0A1E7JWL8_9ACTN|nr:copper chaperone PCu(A)C [Streptomyces oceani]OEU96045.1 copper resistance protein CopZ [Streptomyces oceani]